MPSIYDSVIPIDLYPNRYTSPYGDDSPVPIYSSVPLKQKITGSCMPCVICEKRKEFLDSYSGLLARRPHRNIGDNVGGGGDSGGVLISDPPIITITEGMYVQADYIIFTYEFDAFGGRDLDTRTQITLPIETQIVGWCEYSNAAPYLFWGGDNRDYGVESSYIDLTAFEENSIVRTNCGANWYGERSSGDMQLKVVTYKGGYIEQDGFGFINVGGVETASIYIPKNIASIQNACIYGNKIADITYNKATNILTFS